MRPGPTPTLPSPTAPTPSYPIRGAPHSSRRDSAAPGSLPSVVPLTSSFHFDGSSMALPNDLPPTPTTEPVARPPLSGAPTHAQLRADVANGVSDDENPV